MATVRPSDRGADARTDAGAARGDSDSSDGWANPAPVGLLDLPVEQRLEPARRRAAGCRRQLDDDRRDRPRRVASPDFSSAGGYGIPFNVVGASTPRSTVSFQYDGESDHMGYPIPSSPSIEGGSDRHLLMIDTNRCTLFELFAAAQGSGGWTAGSGAVWSLGSNDLRTDGWTSADAAGLPIFAGLVRYSEVASGAIAHAIRFTAPQTCAGYIYPARHEAGSGSCSSRPPMGLRVRLKASVDIAGSGPQSQVILTALQRYGMLLADNGSPWYITGAPDGHWNDDELHGLGQLTGTDFEVVDTTGFVNG